jgi:hypothetical protein
MSAIVQLIYFSNIVKLILYMFIVQNSTIFFGTYLRYAYIVYSMYIVSVFSRQGILSFYLKL